MKYRRGDRVEVQGVIEFDQKDGPDNGLFVKIDGHYTTISLPADKLTLVHQQFEPGDEAILDDHDITVVAIDNGRVWIKGKNHFDNIVDIGDLRRPEPVEEPPAPPTPTGTTTPIAESNDF